MATRISKLLKKLAPETKEVALRRIGANVQDPDSDQALTDAFEVAVEDRGIYRMLDLVEPETLDRIYTLTAKDEEKKPEEKKGEEKKRQPRTAKAAIVKRVADKILEKKLSSWLETLDSSLLNAIATDIDLKNVAKGKKELMSQVLEGVMELGAEDLFVLLDTPLLRAACKEGGLEVTDDHTKGQLVTALATGTIEKPEKKERKPMKPSEKKPEMAKGISAIDLNTHYYVAEIHKYCVEHGLKTSGNKKDMIKRILASFEGDKTVEKGYKKEKKPKRKQPEGEKKEKLPKKKAKKEEPATAAPAPAPAPAPKKPEAAAAAEAPAPATKKSEAAPKKPEAAPKKPEAAPKKPEAAPKKPEAAPAAAPAAPAAKKESRRRGK